tara:strand:+ start:4610 stop:5923 length:1314 start_codon:yes stop_codon:yes gene_type:complete
MSLSTEGNAPAAEASPRARLLVLAGLSTGFLLAYLPRAGIAPLATTIQSEFSFDDLQMGRILAIFFAGYFVFQIPGGILGQKLGNRLALPVLHCASALANLLTVMVSSFGTIWFSRLLLGIAQAGMVPCSAQVIKTWFPETQRGIASSLMGSFMSVGSILATGITASLVGPFGWRIPLVLFSLFSFCWAILFYLYFRDRGEAAELPTKAEEIQAKPKVVQRQPTYPRTSLTKQMLRSKDIWLFCIQSGFRAFGYAFFITWFPAYLQYSGDASVQQAGLWSMLPLTGIVIGTLVGGKLIDLIFQRTGNKYYSRSLLCVFSHLFCAVSILLAAWMPPESAIYLITVGTFLSGIGNPSTWVTSMDLGGNQTSVVIAVVNMAGVFGSYSSPIIVGRLFNYIKSMEVPNWNLVLFLFVGVYLAATLSWALINPYNSLSGQES